MIPFIDYILIERQNYLTLIKENLHLFKNMAFRNLNSGFVSDEDVVRWESALRNSLKNDSRYKVKSGALVEVAHVIKQYKQS